MHDVMPSVGFRELPLLTPKECGDLWARIQRLRAHWIRRPGFGNAAFHTLGLACYLDIGPVSDSAEAPYASGVRASNRLLATEFPDLYGRVAETLEGALGAAVEYTSRWALPGFHILDGSVLAAAAEVSPHLDTQHERLSLGGGEPPDGVSSFTVAVALPAGGGGLEYWPRETPSEDLAGADAREPQYLPYELGRLYLHTEKILHRIASGGTAAASGARVTLQGHGILRGSRWELYW